jgi:hypothetical protein
MTTKPFAVAMLLVGLLALAASPAAAQRGAYVNVAQGKPVYMSTAPIGKCVGAGCGASNCVDGVTDGSYPKSGICHTTYAVQPFVEVDLGALYFVSSINVYNRTDCCGSRMSNYRIQTATDQLSWNALPFRGNKYVDFPGQMGTPTTASNWNTWARYVRVSLNSGPEYLNMAEIQVMVWLPTRGSFATFPMNDNIALNKVATLIPDGAGGWSPATPASGCVDGNTNGTWPTDPICHTPYAAPYPSLTVDLGQTYFINTLKLFNRTNCCDSRMTNFTLWTAADGGGPWVNDQIYAGTMRTPTTLDLDPSYGNQGGRWARWVRVELNGYDYFNMAELQVFGVPFHPTINTVCKAGSTQSCTVGTCATAKRTGAADGNSWGACNDFSQCPRTGCPVERYQQSGSIGANQLWCGSEQWANPGEKIHLRTDLTGSTGVTIEIYKGPTLVALTPATADWSSTMGIYHYNGKADYSVPLGGAGLYKGCIRTSQYPAVARLTLDVAGTQTPNGQICSTNNDLCFGNVGMQCDGCDAPQPSTGMLRNCQSNVGSNQHDQCCVAHPGGYACGPGGGSGGGLDAYGNFVPAEFNGAYQYCFDEYHKAWTESTVAPFKSWTEVTDATVLRYSTDPELAFSNSGDPTRWNAGLPGPGAHRGLSGARVSDAAWCWGGTSTFDSSTGLCTNMESCTPGSTRQCNFGTCTQGQQTCMPSGLGYTACWDSLLQCGYWEPPQFQECVAEGQARYSARLLGAQPGGPLLKYYAQHLPAPAGSNLTKMGFDGVYGQFLLYTPSCHVSNVYAKKICTSPITYYLMFERDNPISGFPETWQSAMVTGPCQGSGNECTFADRQVAYGSGPNWQPLSGPSIVRTPAGCVSSATFPVFNQSVWGVLQSGCVGGVPPTAGTTPPGYVPSDWRLCVG